MRTAYFPRQPQRNHGAPVEPSSVLEPLLVLVLVRTGSLSLLVGAALLAGSARAVAAETPPAPPCQTRKAPEPRVGQSGSAALSLVPGALVHGSGHFARGEDATALSLLWMEGAGIGTVLLSGTTLVLTGASRYFVGPAALGVIGGIGLFSTTFLADVYGTLAPPCGFGRYPDRVPYLETTSGYRYVFDPQFDYRHFFVMDTTVRVDRLRLTPSGWWSLDTPNERLRLEGGLRLLGARPHERAPAGTYLEVTTAGTHHEFDTEGFGITTFEIAVGGRLDLEALGPTLSGAFSEAEAGLANAHTGYDGDIAGDHHLLLLARFGFGMYLGAGRGEAQLYYDHRHDGFAAGAILPGLGSGVAGHFGASGFYYFTDTWGLGGEAMVGSAYVAGLSARFRQK